MPLRSNFRSTVVDRLRFAKGQLAAARSAALDECGVRTLSWVWEQYRVKARGGADVWGQTWAPLKIVSIGGRLLKRAVGRPVLRKMRRGPAYKAARAAILWKACTDPKFVPKFYAAVQAEMARHETGVDSGRQVNSLQFGKPDNITRKSDAAITLGTNVRYAPWFDAKRPIFPKQLTAAQVDELRRIAGKYYVRALQGKGAK